MVKTYKSEELREFIRKAQAATYAGGGKFELVPERTGFKELTFNDGDWFYRDSFTGWFKSRGMEVVRFNNEPVWATGYGGGMIDVDKQLTHECFDFLKTVLGVDNKGFDSFRGPEYLQLGNWEYFYHQEGNLEDFWGQETINWQKKPVFRQRIGGGLITH